MYKTLRQTLIIATVAILITSIFSGSSLGATEVELKDLDYGDYGARYVHLDWSRTEDLPGVFESYEVFILSQDGNWSFIERIKDPDVSDFNVTDLSPSTDYWFKIRDCDKLGYKDSEQWTIRTASLAPVSLSQPQAKDIGTSSITLRWWVDYTNPHIREYRIIERNDTPAQEVRLTSDNEYTAKGLESNTTYCFWIMAENDLGEWSDPSNKVWVTTSVVGEKEQASSLPWIVGILIAIIVIMALIMSFLLFHRRRP